MFSGVPQPCSGDRQCEPGRNLNKIADSLDSAGFLLFHICLLRLALPKQRMGFCTVRFCRCFPRINQTGALQRRTFRHAVPLHDRLREPESRSWEAASGLVPDSAGSRRSRGLLPAANFPLARIHLSRKRLENDTALFRSRSAASTIRASRCAPPTSPLSSFCSLPARRRRLSRAAAGPSAGAQTAAVAAVCREDSFAVSAQHGADRADLCCLFPCIIMLSSPSYRPRRSTRHCSRIYVQDTDLHRSPHILAPRNLPKFGDTVRQLFHIVLLATTLSRHMRSVRKNLP